MQISEIGGDKTRAELGGSKALLPFAIVQSSIRCAWRIERPIGRPKPLHPAAFLIDQHGRGSAQYAADFIHQRAHRRRRRDVALEKNKAPRLRFAKECAFSVGQFCAGKAGNEGAHWGRLARGRRQGQGWAVDYFWTMQFPPAAFSPLQSCNASSADANGPTSAR